MALLSYEQPSFSSLPLPTDGGSVCCEEWKGSNYKFTFSNGQKKLFCLYVDTHLSPPEYERMRAQIATFNEEKPADLIFLPDYWKVTRGGDSARFEPYGSSPCKEASPAVSLVLMRHFLAQYFHLCSLAVLQEMKTSPPLRFFAIETPPQ